MLEMPTSSQEIKQTQVRLVSKGHQRFVGEPNWRLCSELVGDPKPHRVEDGFRVEIASRKRNRAGVGVRITKICVAVFKSANDMIGQGGIDAEASRPPGSVSSMVSSSIPGAPFVKLCATLAIARPAVP